MYLIINVYLISGGTGGDKERKRKGGSKRRRDSNASGGSGSDRPTSKKGRSVSLLIKIILSNKQLENLKKKICF